MNLATILASGFASVVLTSLVACSGGAAGGAAFEQDSTQASPSDNSAPGAGFGQGNPKPAPASNAACVTTSTATASARPVYLVFAYDQSGSMSLEGKWTAAGTAMKSFFSSPSVAGIHASMTLFPKYDAYPAFCNESEYTSPDVTVTDLPNAKFGAALDATGPQYGKGGTPTQAALSGAMSYAQSLQKTVAKDAIIAVVMVTDGVPEICADKGDVGPAAAVALANASSIPTYIVGVGSDLANLNAIAAAGGTKQALMVSVGDPTQTQKDLSAAIDTIKVASVSCDYAIPSPPDGETLDPAKLNVQYTPTGGAPQELDYDATCASGSGWHYDDATHPTKVIACGSTCTSIKNVGGKVDMQFGCATHVATVK